MIYTVHFYTEADWAVDEFEADTPEQALELAQQLASDDLGKLNFESYHGSSDVEHIEILYPNGHTATAWRSPDLLLRLAASDLLEALQYCDMTLADLECSKRKGYIAQAIKLTRAALAKAKGGAA